MRRINRFFLLLCICVLLVLMSGCGLIPLAEELSATEVLTQAQGQLRGLTGYRILAKGQSSQVSTTSSGRQQNRDVTFEMDQWFNDQPPALHSVLQEWYADGQSAKKELYIVDGVSYNHNGRTWAKSRNESADIVLSQNPLDVLRFAAEAGEQGVTLGKDRNSYVIHLDQVGGKRFLQQFYHEAMGSLQAQGINVREGDFQTNHFQQLIWIDEETFAFQKMEMELSFTTQYGGTKMEGSSRLTVLYQEGTTEQIQVPANVKKSVGE